MTRCLRLLVAFVASAATLALPMGARASLIGDTVNCTNSISSSLVCTPPSAVVTDPGVEFTLLFSLAPTFTVDIDDTTVSLTNISSIGLGGSGELLTFTSLGDTSQGAVTGATLTSSDVAEFDQADVSFTSDSVSLNLTSTNWSQGQDALITLTFANEPGQGVPEPSTLLLLGAGAFALGLRSRRRKA